ncbi:MFS transporter [Candidatus Bathyarchaeota archaeon]|nr:MFS transporter [Candidatus Bathyarchaeota archaeon]
MKSLSVVLGAKSRVLIILFAFSFLQGIVNGIWGFLPIYILDLGGSSVDIGVQALASGLASTFMQLAWGRLVDKVGHSLKMTSIGFLSASIFSIPVIFSIRPWHIVASTAIMSIFTSISGVASVIMLADLLDPKHRAGFMGIYNPIGFGGNILGSLGAGLLIPIIGYRLVFLLYSLLNLVMATLIVLGLKGEERGNGDFHYFPVMLRSFRELIEGFRALPGVMRRGGAYTRWVLGISMRGLGLAMFGPVLTVYLVRILNASTVQIGSLNSIAFGVRMVSSPMLGVIADRKGAKRIMMIGVALASIYPILSSNTSDLLQMTPIFALNGLFWGFINSSWLAWQLNLIPEEHGTYAALLNFINGLEWAIGPFIGGLLSEYLGVKIPAALSSIAILLGLSILLKVPERVEGRRQELK